MKIMKLFAGLVAGAFLVGCAGTPTTDSDGTAITNSRLDVKKMNQVEQSARMAGLEVIWVHPPLKKEGDE